MLTEKGQSKKFNLFCRKKEQQNVPNFKGYF